jgi:hypothetical protein
MARTGGSWAKKKENDMRIRCVAILAGIFLATWIASAVFADPLPTLSVSSPSTVALGGSFAVDVNITNPLDIYDYQFDLSFNPSVLQLTNIAEGSFLLSGGSTFFLPGFVDNAGGTASFNADTLETAISGVSVAGTLVEFDFTAMAAGISNFGISNVFLQNSKQAGMIPPEFLDFAPPIGGSVEVQGSKAVPEPSSALLLFAGVSGLFLLTIAKRVT